ncbi:HD domain-containing phosphohydrolase [Celerinatantimonas yamalensis]|uniref:HD domain-containing phosphohydrolase n=1 Tax=Celerinatantimonas yamalensis TaxID=559956 RepID=A0ABW9G617_9GAMM
MRRLKHIAFSMRVTVVSLFTILSIVIVAVALGLQYYFSQSLAHDAAKTQFNHVAQRISDEIRTLDRRSTAVVSLLSQYLENEKTANIDSKKNLVLMMAQAMKQAPFLYAMYVGYPNGDFYELVNLNNSAIAKRQLAAAAQDRWVIIYIHNTPQGRRKETLYYNSSFILTHKKIEKSNFYSNVRPWYHDALITNDIIKTSPYLFANTQSPGVTYAKKIAGSKEVIAADVSLEILNHYLKISRPSDQSETIIFDKNGNITADSLELKNRQEHLKATQLNLTKEEKSYIKSLGTLVVSNELNWPPFDFSISGVPQGYSIDVMKLLAQKLGLKISFSNGYNWHSLTSLFKQNQIDILHSIFKNPTRESWGLYTQPYIKLSTAIASLAKESDFHSMSQLNGKIVAIPKDWALMELMKKNYPLIHIKEVKDSLEALVAVQEKHADATIDTNYVLRYLTNIHKFNKINIYDLPKKSSLNENQDLSILIHNHDPQLRDLLNKAIQSITPREHHYFKLRWLDKNSISNINNRLWAGVVPDQSFTQLAKLVTDKSPNKVIDSVKIDGINYIIYVHKMKYNLGNGNYIGVMTPTSDIEEPYMVKVYISLTLTLVILVLMTPILIYLSRMIVLPVKRLSIQNMHIKNREFSSLNKIKSHITEINELSSSMYSMSISIVKHEQKQKKLLDSFIQLIAQTIDDKSPFTGKHCARVPELAMMLAQAANTSPLPIFKNFDFDDQKKQYEFNIAAWLHDCGKITTPEHIIDKGSKLETIYNRIHEIRTRFEVLWRDIEIDYWKSRSLGEDKALLDIDLREKQKQILDDFAFIAQCNIGTESMDKMKLQRIQQIAALTWTRHFDDRLGLSPQESKVAAQSPSHPLPVTEHLLADKPEHLFPWTHNPRYQMRDEINMIIPKLSANTGELYNLSIPKGTLTAEERFRINEHIISTISMLESLPLPAELARVPEIAGGHHETLIGTGYPKGLTAKDLSMEARILAIADVFEALTASDRPYKKAKTLSEALAILAVMVQEKKLDPDVFNLLITSNVYKKYAEKFLDQSQCDECDVSKYLLEHPH